MGKIYVGIFTANRRTYLQNGVFAPQNQDEWTPIFVYLKKYLREQGIALNTIDYPTEKPVFKYVYVDLPYVWQHWNLPIWKTIVSNRTKNILICHESPIIIPYNYWKILHLNFTKIYTWNDDLVDNKKYFKIHLPQSSFGIGTTVKEFKNKKLLILINSNKLSFPPFRLLSQFGKELYSNRIEALEFFDHTIPSDFSLYGRGWNKTKKYNITERFFGYKKYHTYKGEVEIKDKIELLSNFKFCICFENITEVDGYITEKIFHSFLAKCVPIYWGASNIEKYIPKSCFIDFRDFGNYATLLKFLVSMDETRYNRFIKNIRTLLSDKRFTDVWFEEGFAKFFLNDILELN